MPTKYDSNHQANPGFTADPDKVAALKKNVSAIHASKSRAVRPPADAGEGNGIGDPNVPDVGTAVTARRGRKKAESAE